MSFTLGKIEALNTQHHNQILENHGINFKFKKHIKNVYHEVNKKFTLFCSDFSSHCLNFGQNRFFNVSIWKE